MKLLLQCLTICHSHFRVKSCNDDDYSDDEDDNSYYEEDEEEDLGKPFG